MPWLRLRVARLRSARTARTFPGRIEVVSPAGGSGAGERSAGEDLPPIPLDRGLRVDLICALMSAVPGPCAVVVSRAEHHDACGEDDLAWTGAAAAAAHITAAHITAAAIAPVDLGAVVMLSRWGWLDLLSGRRRDWKRLRIRPA